MVEKEKPVFWSDFFEQKKSLEKLIAESAAGPNFYTMLSLSAIITTLGLVVDNIFAIVGGMLVAPLLFPILSLSMGVTTSNRDSIIRSLSIIGRSVVLVVGISIMVSFLFKYGPEEREIVNQLQPNLVFLLIAFAAGIASAYAWVKQNVSASLPGVAVSVSLIPPICAVGVGIVIGSSAIISDSLTLFIINFFGIAVAGLIVFSLFGFSRLQKEEEKLIQEEKSKKLFDVRGKLQENEEKLKEVEEKIVETEVDTRQ